tara:strand:- start:211 stop:1224 length:1014 start_codon:yes stop_codon:yes gene_type:complete
MKKKAIITGITGMVGSHLCDYLFDNTDLEIHGILRWRSPLINIKDKIKNIENFDRVFLHYADINDLSSLIKIMDQVKPDYVFHLAAQSFPRTSFDIPLETIQTNILGTTNLLESIKFLGLQNTWIHICSSSEVFGRVDKKNIPIKEDNTFHPASPYAISKVGTDLIGRFYAEAYKLKTITTRMFTHTGPRRGDVFAESSFAKQIALIETGQIQPIVKVGNLKSLRTYGDVRDAVRAYYMALTINPIPGEFYNIGGHHTCEVGEVLNKLISLSTCKKIEVQVDKDRLRPIDADLQVPDVNKFHKHTGWKNEIKFEDTMIDLLNYWRDRIKISNDILSR